MSHRIELKQKNSASGIAGLGFRREMLSELKKNPPLADVDFFEIAPENWLAIGGRFAKD